jgi:hypothetical protein
VFRRGRPIWQTELPLAELAVATFPKLVVSGGHSAGFEAICDELAERIGAARALSKVQATRSNSQDRRSTKPW